MKAITMVKKEKRKKLSPNFLASANFQLQMEAK